MIHLDNASGMIPLWNMAIPLFSIIGILLLVVSIVMAARKHSYQSIMVAMLAIVFALVVIVGIPQLDRIRTGNRNLFENAYGISTQHTSMVDKGDEESFGAVIGMAKQGTYKIKTDKGQHAGKTLDVIIDKNGGVKVVDHATGRAMTPKTGKGGE